MAPPTPATTTDPVGQQLTPSASRTRTHGNRRRRQCRHAFESTERSSSTSASQSTGTIVDGLAVVNHPGHPSSSSSPPTTTPPPHRPRPPHSATTTSSPTTLRRFRPAASATSAPAVRCHVPRVIGLTLARARGSDPREALLVRPGPASPLASGGPRRRPEPTPRSRARPWHQGQPGRRPSLEPTSRKVPSYHCLDVRRLPRSGDRACRIRPRPRIDDRNPLHLAFTRPHFETSRIAQGAPPARSRRRGRCASPSRP